MRRLTQVAAAPNKTSFFHPQQVGLRDSALWGLALHHARLPEVFVHKRLAANAGELMYKRTVALMRSFGTD